MKIPNSDELTPAEKIYDIRDRDLLAIKLRGAVTESPGSHTTHHSLSGSVTQAQMHQFLFFLSNYINGRMSLTKGEDANLIQKGLKTGTFLL